MTASVTKLETISSVTSPSRCTATSSSHKAEALLISFSLFIVASLQQCGILPDRLLHLGIAFSHHYGICLRLNHLPSEIRRLGHIPSQALHKRKKQQQQ
jgi:hypothetical protein